MPAFSTRVVVPAVLVGALVLLQYQIWNGRGSMGQVTLMQQQLLAQRASNQRTEADIARLQSEVKDLKEGVDTVEAKARYELGMVKANEIFVQIAH